MREGGRGGGRGGGREGRREGIGSLRDYMCSAVIVVLSTVMLQEFH